MVKFNVIFSNIFLHFIHVEHIIIVKSGKLCVAKFEKYKTFCSARKYKLTKNTKRKMENEKSYRIVQKLVE